MAGQRPVSSLCPSALGPPKVGAGASPKKAFGSRLRQAKRSACPTRGWVKPSLQSVAADGHGQQSALRGDVAILFFLLFFSSLAKRCPE